MVMTIIEKEYLEERKRKRIKSTLQLVEIVNLADIVRSEKGNSVLDYYHFDTGQDIE